MSISKIQAFYLKKQALKHEVAAIETQFKSLSNKRKLSLASLLVSNFAVNKNAPLLSKNELLDDSSSAKVNVDIFDNLYSLLLLPFLKKYTVNAIQHEKLQKKFVGYALLYGLPILLKQFNEYMAEKSNKADEKVAKNK
jgi:hypothetical protein